MIICSCLFIYLYSLLNCDSRKALVHQVVQLGLYLQVHPTYGRGREERERGFEMVVIASFPCRPGSPGPQLRGSVCSLLVPQQALLHHVALSSPALPSRLSSLLPPVALGARMAQFHPVLPTDMSTGRGKGCLKGL